MLIEVLPPENVKQDRLESLVPYGPVNFKAGVMGLFAGKKKSVKNTLILEAVSPALPAPSRWNIFIDGKFYTGMPSKEEAERTAEWCDLFIHGKLPSQMEAEEKKAIAAYAQAQMQRHQMY